MTTKAAFSPEEWKVVLEGPPTAGMIVVTAARGGTFRETIAMAKAYTEARAEHGDSELLDEIAATKPKLDRTRYHSAEELRDNGLAHLRSAVALLESATAPIIIIQKMVKPIEVPLPRRSIFTFLLASSLTFLILGPASR